MDKEKTSAPRRVRNDQTQVLEEADLVELDPAGPDAADRGWVPPVDGRAATVQATTSGAFERAGATWRDEPAVRPPSADPTWPAVAPAESDRPLAQPSAEPEPTSTDDERWQREADALAPGQPTRAALLLSLRARAALDAADPTAAAQALAQAEALAPEARFVGLTRRWIAEHRGDPAASAAAARAELPLAGDALERSLLLWQIAAIEQHAGRPESAARALRDLVALDPQDLGAHLALGALAARQKNWRAAADAWETVATRTDDAAARAAFHTAAASARECFLSDRFGARASLERALEADAAAAATQSALESLQLRAQAWPDYARLLLHEADRVGDLEPALAYHERAGDILWECLNDGPAAATAYRRAAAAPGGGAALAKLAGLCEHDGRQADLVSVYEELAAKTQEPLRRAGILLRLGTLYERLDRRDDALRAHQQALQAAPTLAAAAQSLAAHYQERGRWADLTKLLLVEADRLTDPIHRAARYTAIAQTREAHLGADDEAMSLYERALALDPAQAAALDAIDRIYRARERWHPLAVLYEQQLARARDPRRIRALHLALAELHQERLAAPDRAATHLRAVLAEPPDHPDFAALTALGRAQAEAGQWHDHVEALETQARLLADPQEIAAALYRAATVVEIRLEDPNRALALHESILEKSPGHPQALEAIRRIHRTESRWDDLLIAENRLLETTERPEEAAAILVRMAQIAEEQLGRPEQAIAAHEQALAVHPANRLAQVGLERLLRSQGHYPRLATLLEERAASTEDPVERAQALCQAALLREVHGQEDRAGAAADRAAAEDRAAAGADEDFDGAVDIDMDGDGDLDDGPNAAASSVRVVATRRASSASGVSRAARVAGTTRATQAQPGGAAGTAESGARAMSADSSAAPADSAAGRTMSADSSRAGSGRPSRAQTVVAPASDDSSWAGAADADSKAADAAPDSRTPGSARPSRALTAVAPASTDSSAARPTSADSSAAASTRPSRAQTAVAPPIDAGWADATPTGSGSSGAAPTESKSASAAPAESRPEGAVSADSRSSSPALGVPASRASHSKTSPFWAAAAAEPPDPDRAASPSPSSSSPASPSAPSGPSTFWATAPGATASSKSSARAASPSSRLDAADRDPASPDAVLDDEALYGTALGADDDAHLGRASRDTDDPGIDDPDADEADHPGARSSARHRRASSPGLASEAAAVAHLPVARALYERALAASPGFPAALWGLHRIGERCSDWPAAAAALEELARSASHPLARSRLLVRLARLAELRLGQPGRAADLYSEALELEEQPAAVFDRLRVALASDSADAPVWLERAAAAATDPRLATGLLRLAAAAIEYGPGRETAGPDAVAAAHEAVLRNGSDARALEGVARNARSDDRRTAEALAGRGRTMRDATTRGLVLCSAGALYERADRAAEAEAAYGDALTAVPGLLPAMAGRRRLREGAGDWAGAATACADMAASARDRQNRVELFEDAARLCRDRLGDLALAAQHYRAVLTARPGHRAALERTLEILEQTGDWVEAVSVLSDQVDALGDDRSRAELLGVRARILAERLGDAQAAIADLQRSLRLRPDTDLLHLLAELHESTGHWADAASAYQRRAETAPDPESARAARLAQARIWVDAVPDYPRAQRILEEVVAEAPGDRASLLRLADVALRAGDAGRAVAAYQRLAEGGKPEHRAAAYLAVADLQRQLGDDLAGDAAAGGAFDLVAESPAIAGFLEQQFRARDEMDRYVLLADAALTRMPLRAAGALPLRLSVAQVLRHELGAPEHALEHLQQAARGHPRAAAPRIALAEALAERDPDAAIAELRRIVETDPTETAAYRGLGAICQAQGWDAPAALMITAAALVGGEPVSPELERTLTAAPHPLPGSLPPDDALRLLVGPTQEAAVREILDHLDPYLPAIFPDGQELVGMLDALPESSTAAAVAQSIAQALAVSSIEIMRGDAGDPLLLLSEPRALALGPAHLDADTGPARTRFDAAFALSRLAAGSAVGQVVEPDRVQSLLRVATDPEATDPPHRELRRHLASAMPRRARKELERAAADIGVIDHRRWAAWEQEERRRARRAGVVFSRDLRAAAASLAPEAIAASSPEQRRALLAASDAMVDALRFAASDACWSLCRRLFRPRLELPPGQLR